VIATDQTTTIGEAFARAVEAYAERPFLCAPAGDHRSYHRDGYEIDFATAGRAVEALSATFAAAGYGPGHRVAMLLDNRPEHYLYKLALNAIGVCIVPVNPDYRAGESAYLLDHAKPDLVLVISERREQIAAGLAQATHQPPMILFDDLASLPRPRQPARDEPVTAQTWASILYTSGTTGRPKGCILSHGYEVACGVWYATRGGLARFDPKGERIYNPLPAYHVNASVVAFPCAIVSGSCHIQTDRFHPLRWWREVAQTRASIVHYLGVIVPMLLNTPPSPEEHQHVIRFGFGAGAEPQLHQVFEQRFGFPLIEIWGMTEMVRILIDNEEPRRVGTRAFGKPVPGIEVRVVDEHDHDVPRGQPGEMVLRFSEATPRRDFFSGYLDDDAATEHAWRGGWFHTGDTVKQAEDGMLHFVDRKKNIIRRSGENIAAAEIEAVLQAHDLVSQVAVLAVPDAIREEEVFACIVLASDGDRTKAAETLFAHCNQELAYFKAPGWILFVDQLPTTGTQKIQKHQIFADGRDPCTSAGVFDLRARKKR
jgi:crotonobetaine/carnitine-CoA ligase